MALKELNTYRGAGWMWSLRFPCSWEVWGCFSSPQRHCCRLKRLLWVPREEAGLHSDPPHQTERGYRAGVCLHPRVQRGSWRPGDRGATSLSWGAVSTQTLALQESQPTSSGGRGPSWGRSESDPGTHRICLQHLLWKRRHRAELHMDFGGGGWTQAPSSLLQLKCLLQVTFSISYVSPGTAEGFCVTEGDQAALLLLACSQHILTLLLLAWPSSVQGGCSGGWQWCL